MLPSETMIWQPEFTDKTLSRKPGAVHLVVDGKVWRTVYYRFATREEREGKVSTNLIFKECRQSAAMKRLLRVYKRTSMGTQ
ncbi:hypothetical protein [Escherichia coli]|uniref:hypothetical protein n=1 Tax=Escherichia coli TaxID=562 RepID=UPI001D16CA15|nr:hypothetical protein [Escherichia coli]MCC3824121.1 hypothetical protein [Escherichia coli]